MLNHKTKGGEEMLVGAILQKVLDIVYRIFSGILGLIPI